MVRNLLVLFVFLGVSFGASVAQSDVFLRQSPKAEVSEGEEEKPKKKSIFLRPFKKDAPKTSNVYTRLQAKLNVKGVRRQIEQDLKTLNYWQSRKVKPQNIEEMRSYAFALRVNQRAAMLKETELARVARANLKIKHEAALQRTIAERSPNAFAAANATQGKTNVHKEYRGQNSDQKKRVTRIYRAGDKQPEKPSRVIRDYR